jgi:GDP-D-mannose 3', 5'-epimerase
VSAGAVDAVVAGGGGFIGGRLVRELLRQGLTVRSVDVKPFSEGYQVTSDAERVNDNVRKDLGV